MASTAEQVEIVGLQTRDRQPTVDKTSVNVDDVSDTQLPSAQHEAESKKPGALHPAVVKLLCRHSLDNQLCCGDENNHFLRVTGTDGKHKGVEFVTLVTCTGCDRLYDATCDDKGWTNERIYNVSALKPGDHICWHRWYFIWHHAIVASVTPGSGDEPPKVRIINYSNKCQVVEEDMPRVESSLCGECNALYRVNYMDCYTGNYVADRAAALVKEQRYDLFERNCEHFARLCKTGLTSSSQVSTFWTSLGKIALTMLLRLAWLVSLGFIVGTTEEQVSTMRSWADNAGATSSQTSGEALRYAEKVLVMWYMAFFTVLVMAYLLRTSCLELTPREKTCGDVESGGGSSENGDDATPSTGCCCFAMVCCCTLIFRALRAGLCFCCDYTNFTPLTCCRRPGNVACATFFRIFIREAVAAAGLFLVVWYDERISHWMGIEDYPAGLEAFLLMLFGLGIHLAGYVLGYFLGRGLAAFFQHHLKTCSDEKVKKLQTS